MTDEFVVPDGSHLIICPAITSLSRPIAAARSIMADCGHEIWVAPSSLDMIASDLPTITACMECSVPALTRYNEQHPEESVQLRMAPGANEEIQREFSESLNIPIPTISEEEYDKAVEDTR